MNKAWCPLCGNEVLEAHGRTGPILLDTTPGPAIDRVRIQIHNQHGTTTHGDYTIHRCKEIRFPKRNNIDAVNAARRAVGLEPYEERGDSA